MLKHRIYSAVVILPFFLGGLIFGPAGVALGIFATLSFLATRESCRIALRALEAQEVPTVLTGFSGLALFLCCVLAPEAVRLPIAVFGLFLPLPVAVFR